LLNHSATTFDGWATRCSANTTAEQCRAPFFSAMSFALRLDCIGQEAAPTQITRERAAGDIA
jgi:hypothetical protein